MADEFFCRDQAGEFRAHAVAALALAVVALVLAAASGHRAVRESGPIRELAQERVLAAMKLRGRVA